MPTTSVRATPKVAGNFLDPAFERRLLEVAQTEPEGLVVGLQVFVRHRSDGCQTEFLGEVDIRCAAKMLGDFTCKGLHRLLRAMRRSNDDDQSRRTRRDRLRQPVPCARP